MRFVALLMLCLCSCAELPRGEGEVTWVYDYEKSFQDGAIAATAVAGAVISAGVSKAQEVTTQQANKLKTSETLGAQGVEKFKIGEDTKKFLHSTPNPNLP